MVLLFVLLALSIIIYTSVEIYAGIKRGGVLESFRLFTVIIAAVLSVIISLLWVLLAIKPGFMNIPDALIPLTKELSVKFALPLSIFILFILIKALMLFIYVPMSKTFFDKAKEKQAENKGKTVLNGILCASFISIIITIMLILPASRLKILYKDYCEHKESIKTLYALSKGENIAASELIDSVDSLSSYILSMPYASDEAKIKAMNYAVETLNATMKASENPALNAVSLNTYDDISSHEKQRSSVIDAAKTLEEVGLLEDINSTSSINQDNVLKAVSSEDNARKLVDAVENIDGGGEVLSDVINNMVNDYSNGEIKNIVNEEALKNVTENKEAIVNSLMEAETFKNFTEDDFSKMTPEEKKELINKIETIKSYGVVNEDACNDLIKKIKKSMK